MRFDRRLLLGLGSMGLSCIGSVYGAVAAIEHEREMSAPIPDDLPLEVRFSVQAERDAYWRQQTKSNNQHKKAEQEREAERLRIAKPFLDKAQEKRDRKAKKWLAVVGKEAK